MFHAWTAWAARAYGATLGSAPRFPLGSLGAWDDLLALNKRICRRTAEPVPAGVVPGVFLQWTFHQPSCCVVRADHVARVFKTSVSRQLQPAVLSAVGLRHFRAFFGTESVGVTDGPLWSSTRKAMGKY